jgi:hypothetical protein
VYTNALTVPLSPDDMWSQAVQSKRGFESTPSGPEDAARRRLQTMPSDALRPDEKGPKIGKGYETFGSIQVIDKDGRRVAIGAEWFDGGDHEQHAEAKTIRALESKGVNRVEGGKIVVVVDQVPCKHCEPRLKSWAQKLGAAELEVHVPERESLVVPGKSVTPKQAATTSFRNTGKPTRLKKLWTHKPPAVVALPLSPGGSRSASSAIKGSIIIMIVGFGIGFAQDALASELKANLDNLPKPTIDKRGAEQYFADPKTGKAIRMLDLLAKETRPFSERLSAHHATFVSTANAEIMLLAVSRIGFEERIDFLSQMLDQMSVYEQELLTINSNLEVALSLEAKNMENARNAQQLSQLMERALVLDYLLKNSNLSFDELIQIHDNLKDFADRVRSTFQRLRDLEALVKQLREEANALSSNVSKIKWQILAEKINEEMKKRGIAQ